jgi:hypothetical protein
VIGQFQVPTALPWRKHPSVPTGPEAGWSVRGGKEKNLCTNWEPNGPSSWQPSQYTGQVSEVALENTGKKSKAVPLHAMEALGGRGGIAPTHSRPRH